MIATKQEKDAIQKEHSEIKRDFVQIKNSPKKTVQRLKDEVEGRPSAGGRDSITHGAARLSQSQEGVRAGPSISAFCSELPPELGERHHPAVCYQGTRTASWPFTAASPACAAAPSQADLLLWASPPDAISSGFQHTFRPLQEHFHEETKSRSERIKMKRSTVEVQLSNRNRTVRAEKKDRTSKIPRR